MSEYKNHLIYRALVDTMVECKVSGKPIVKEIRDPTGSGKTYYAVRACIDLFQEHQVYSIYMAPSKKLVDDFTIELKTELKKRDLDIPIYRLFARSDFEDNDSFLTEIEAFAIEVKNQFNRLKPKQNLELFAEDTQAFLPDPDVVTASEGVTVSEKVRTLERQISGYRSLKKWVKTGFSSKDDEEDLRRLLTRIMSITKTLCTGIVKSELLGNHKKGLFSNTKIRPVLEKIDPLNLFKHRPGIIVTTGSKVSTRASEVVLETNKMQIEFARKKEFEDYYNWAEETDNYLYLLIDEEESCYAYAQEALKKTLTKKDVDQHRFIYAFFHYFDVGVCHGYERYENKAFARKIFFAMPEFLFELKKIAAAINDKLVADPTPLLKQLKCFQSFSMPEISLLATDYFAMQDSETNFKVLKSKLLVMVRIINFLKDRRERRHDAPYSFDLFDDYVRLVDVMHDKKRMLAHKDLIRSHRKDFDYIFFNERLEIFDHSVLSNIFIKPVLAGCNLELVSRDRVHNPESNFTLGEFLQFIMLLTRITMKTIIVGGNSRMIKVTDNQAKVLRDYKGKIGKWGLDTNAIDEMLDRKLPDFLDVDYVFKGSKFVLSIIEEDADAPEYSNDMRWMSLMATVQKTTPERQLVKFTRAENLDPSVPRNAIALMSATGGSQGCNGTFNLRYLNECLLESGGRVQGSTQDELKGMVAFREQRLALRSVDVINFTRTDFRQNLSVSPFFNELRKDVMVEFQQGNALQIRPNPYKIDELDYVFSVVDAIVSTDRRSACVFTQSVQHIKRVVDGLADRGMGFSREPVQGYYRFDPSQFGVDGDPVMFILYSSKFGKEIGAHRIVDGQLIELRDEDVEIEDADFTILENLLDERQNKVIFIAPFKAAGRGISLTPKCDLSLGAPHPRDISIGKKDFDILMIAMSPYYDGLYRTPDTSANQMERLTAMLNYLYMNNRLHTTSHAELPLIVQDEHEVAFLPEYYRYVGREITQTLGRVERVGGSELCGAPNHQLIFINREIVVELAHYYRLEPTVVDRISPNNWRVYKHVQDFQLKTRLHSSEEEWATYCEDEIDLDERFIRASKSLYRGFHRQSMREIWQILRSPDVFTDPVRYVKKIKSLSPSIQVDDWKGFVDYSFRERSVDEFYLTTVKDEYDPHAKPIQIYSDLYHGKGSRFEPVALLAPNALRSNRDFSSACARSGINLDTIFMTHIPRPRFFFDYIKGYFAELIFEKLLSNRNAISLLDSASHPRANEIFERFDFFIDRPDKILALDVKSWGRNAERLLSKKLQENAVKKTKIVEKALDKKVEPCYINLYGEKPMMSEVINGKIVRFFNIFVISHTDDGYPSMELNRQLFAYLETGNV
jgi:hypothetical protein